MKIQLRFHKNNRGSALVISLAVLALITIMALAFSVNMRVEQRISKVLSEQTGAKFIAQAGLHYAVETLIEDYNDDLSDYSGDTTHPNDHTGEEWVTSFSGNDIDLDEDSTNESEWIYVHENANGTGDVIGRFAVLIQDEAGKININTAGTGDQDEGFSTYEVSLQALTGIDSAKADKIEQYRYGDDRKQSYSPTRTYVPGLSITDTGTYGRDDNNNNAEFENDEINNDADGFLDEGDEGKDDPTEFDPDYPFFNDTPFISLEELYQVTTITDTDIENNRNLATVWNRDINQYYNGSWQNRFNINHIISATVLYQMLENIFDPSPPIASWATENALRYTANIIDYADRDHYLTVCDYSGSEKKTFGLEGIQINEVKNTLYGISLENNGIIDIPTNIGKTWPAFSNTESPSEWNPNGGSPAGALHYIDVDNSAGSSEIWKTHTFRWNFDPGTYQIVVVSGSGTAPFYFTLEDQSNLTINPSSSYNLPSVTVTDDDGDDEGEINLTIWRNIPIGVHYQCSFDRIIVYAGRFVELVNISKEDIILDATNTGNSHKLVLGGTLSFPSEGQPAVITGGTAYSLSEANFITQTQKTFSAADPEASSNPPFDYNYIIIADSLYAIDALYGDANGTWDNTPTSEPGRIFPLGVMNTNSAELKQDISLCDKDSKVLAFIPRDEPNSDYNIKGWLTNPALGDYDGGGSNAYSFSRTSPVNFASTWVQKDLSTGTPGKVNAGSAKSDSGNNEYWNIKDRSFANIGEVGFVFQGTANNNTLEDYEIETLLNRITTSYMRLEAEDASAKGFTGGYSNGFDGTTRYEASGAGPWTWTWTFDSNQWWNSPFRLVNGAQYDVFLYGDFSRDFELPSGTDRVVRPNDSIYIGTHTITQSGSNYQLSFDIFKEGTTNPVIDFIVLVPKKETIGRININTAPAEVLDGLNITTTTSTIIGGRPYAHVGQLLNDAKANLSESEFKNISNLVTTRSDHFKIIIQGEAIEDVDGDGVEGDSTDVIRGRLRMKLVVDRNPQFHDPGNPKEYKIDYLHYEEID